MDIRLDVLLHAMHDAATEAAVFTKGLDRDGFVANGLLQNAVAMTLLRVGESATKIMQEFPDFVDARSDLRWASMRGLRNVIAHAYHELDFVIMWRIVADHLPPLIAQLDAILDPPVR